jgi:Hypothetical glycosyl hydrolase 6
MQVRFNPKSAWLGFLKRPAIIRQSVIILYCACILSVKTLSSQTLSNLPEKDDFGWLNTARIFLIDAYQPPFAPRLEFDAEKLAQTMQEMNANVVRMSTMGKYATIQGIRFSTHPDQGNRDLLSEMIAAAKPRGIRVIPYISTGHKLAWSIVTRDYPDYAQRTKPGGGPAVDHMYVGEDMGAICWNTSYRQAYLDYVTHVVRDYDIDGIYFDAWMPFYFWSGRQVCYCKGCVEGFRKATGLDLPWHENNSDYTAGDLETIDKYHNWYREELIGVLKEVRRIVRSYKDIPLIYNINNPEKIVREDPRVIASMDAFLYERGESMLERAEGVSLAKALGIKVMPYIGGYDNWPRLVNNQLDAQQEIFTTLMFGGAPIISQPYPYIYDTLNRKFVSYPFKIISEYENLFSSIKNKPYVAVIYDSFDPAGHAKENWWWNADVRTATLGAFAACLHGHIQVTSAMQTLLDDPVKLSQYKVVYLADNVFLTDQQIKNLRQFVYNGGGLIVSYATSLYNRNRERNATFALQDLIRVRPVPLPEDLKSYQAMIGGPNDLYYLKREGSGLTGSGWDNQLVPLWYYEPVAVLDGGRVIMDIVTGDGRRQVLPGIVLSETGKGKVIYSCSSIESLYYSNGNTVLRDLIESLISTVSSAPAPYTVDAPAGLITNLSFSGNRYLLQMTNWTGNKFEKKHVIEDYIASVKNVTVRFPIPAGHTIEEVKSLTGSKIVVNISADTLEIRLPEAGVYEGIEITLR